MGRPCDEPHQCARTRPQVVSSGTDAWQAASTMEEEEEEEEEVSDAVSGLLRI